MKYTVTQRLLIDRTWEVHVDDVSQIEAALDEGHINKVIWKEDVEIFTEWMEVYVDGKWKMSKVYPK